MWEHRRSGESRKFGALTFIDAAVGGSGFLERCVDDMHRVAERAIDHLDHPNCESACYRCLKTYTNQRHHEHLSWPHIMPDLETMAMAEPETLQLQLGDSDDPSPWLQAYDAGVGSPLELKFLRLFEKHGIEVEKQVPVTPDPGGRPISQADFKVKDRNVLIYIDGAAFHTGGRLRRDRAIRQSLVDGLSKWIVIECTGKDLYAASEIIDLIKRASD